ncbi:MAG: hypothetical protein AAF583_03250 [Pseudomonadota bacterium]
MKQNFDAELELIFREADATYEDDGDQFTRIVRNGVRRAKWIRRLTLSIFAMMGGVLAVFHMPAIGSLLDSFLGLDGQINSVVADALLNPEDANLEWLSAIFVGVMTFFVAFAAEQNSL